MNDIVAEEIAVDLRYRDLVIDHLKRIDDDVHLPAAEPGDSNKTLDLGLIVLLQPQRTAAKVFAKWGTRIPIKPSPQRTRLSETDIILDGIRLEIGESYGGWHPRMGKVRTANVIGGLPHTGAGTYPKARRLMGSSEFLRPATKADGQGVVIGVIDSPISPHPEIDDRLYSVPGFSAEWDERDLYPWLRGHGVAVAGRILRRAPGARLEVRGVLEEDVPRSNVWNVATAMADALDAGVKVLNMSLGCYTLDGLAPFVLDRAVEVLSTKGVAIVAAAGNHGDGSGPVAPNAPIFPAACPGAIAVGAFENAGPYEKASLSPKAPWVALGAPGVGVVTTYLFGKVEFSQLPGLPPAPGVEEFDGYATWSGTSFAAATVSGEIARIMAHTGMDALAAVNKLLVTDPGKNNGVGRYC